MVKQEAQLSLTNRALLFYEVVEVLQDVLSENVDKKFTTDYNVAYLLLHNVQVRMGQMKVWIEFVQLASPLNLKSAQVYILEKTASLPVTDNRSLEKACKITVKNSYACDRKWRKLIYQVAIFKSNVYVAMFMFVIQYYSTYTIRWATYSVIIPLIQWYTRVGSIIHVNAQP